MSGNEHLFQTSGIKLIIDESLSPNVASALAAVGYDCLTVAKAFSNNNSVKDPEIIAWCNKNGRVWVHADDKSRKQHKKLILTSRISTLFVCRPGGKLSSKEQLRILSYILPDLIDRLNSNPSKRHFIVREVGQSIKSRIKLADMPL